MPRAARADRRRLPRRQAVPRSLCSRTPVDTLYYADGQQRDEVYNWGSFLQSRMYRQGVTCSDCHDPHTQQLKAAGNALCAQCHATGKIRRADTPLPCRRFRQARNASIATCPRPTTWSSTARRDHSMRVPRPDQTVALGVPNACNNCHDKKDAPWAAAAVRQWYGHDAQGLQSFRADIPQRRTGQARRRRVACGHRRRCEPAAHRARIGARSHAEHVRPAAAAEPARAGARNTSPLMRLAAARLVGALPPPDRIAVAGPLLTDPLRAVRLEAANALVDIPARATARRAASGVATCRRRVRRMPRSTTPTARNRAPTSARFNARLGSFDEAQNGFARGAQARPATMFPRT